MNTDTQSRFRDNSVDILRGIAIFIMVGANMSPLMVEPHPIFYRIYSSMAAPLFITLVGMSVALCLSSAKPGYTLMHFLKRGFVVLLAGVFVDIAAWGGRPFTTTDVLYLIGISMPLIYLAAKLPRNYILSLAMLIFIITPVLQYFFGYTKYPTEFKLDGSVTLPIEHQTSILNHYMIDGWFPFFPWLGYIIIGLILGKIRWPGGGRINDFSGNQFIWSTLMSIIVGSMLCYFAPGDLYIREGYSEMFYPVTYGFIIVSLSLVVVLLMIVDRYKYLAIFKVFEKLGRNSLFLYIVHCIILGRILGKIFKQIMLEEYLLIYAGFLFVLLGCAYLREWFLDKWEKFNLNIKFLQ